ncbi:hypothetical protein SCD_n01065 [Sulfuricella denitrificans skB26]|uniref:PEP-CTERM protein-sorting domain-containing protein n=1 Tax=Sulfuricella denitrificans (strain DSM 22764 / NBRC 105220 / skB26) TaxID=1163617 RepID=S6AG13_SULDS|nr:VPLPA-CTERM sorting domain-containing protein [Sulfuricella denitrificans]BAN34901.1 hypothetical protein SCD_n01065 [Sulfuricella denitrificans skB26]
MKALASSLALCAVLVSSEANAALIDRGGGLIYDNVLNVTWLQDANYAKTQYIQSGGTQGYANGYMNLSQATTWASNLSYYDSVRNVTYTDWRLPNTNPVNGTAFNYNLSYNGSTDYSYNVSASGTAYAGSTGSEMAHLFYNSLNNKGYANPATSWISSTAGHLEMQFGWGLANTGPFSNLFGVDYLSEWTGPMYSPDGSGGHVWTFRFADGFQGPAGDTTAYAMAVRDGDVAAVPVPAAAWLLGSGLLGLVGVARRNA